MRRKIQIGLNKSEEINGLARAVFFGKRGQFWENEMQRQLQKSSCLNVILNSIVIWNTKYLKKAWEYYKEQHPEKDQTLLKHISPLNWEHINFLGEYFLETDVVYDVYGKLKVPKGGADIFLDHYATKPKLFL